MIVAISVGGCLSCICVGLYLYVQREKPLAVNVFGHQMQADGCPRSSDEHKGTFDSCRGGIPLEGFMELSWPWPSYIVLNWTSGERGLDGSSWLDFMVNAELFVNSIFIIS